MTVTRYPKRCFAKATVISVLPQQKVVKKSEWLYSPPISEERAKPAFMHASLIRKRFTLGDLLIFLRVNQEGMWEKIRMIYPKYLQNTRGRIRIQNDESKGWIKK